MSDCEDEETCDCYRPLWAIAWIRLRWHLWAKRRELRKQREADARRKAELKAFRAKFDVQGLLDWLTRFAIDNPGVGTISVSPWVWGAIPLQAEDSAPARGRSWKVKRIRQVEIVSSAFQNDDQILAGPGLDGELRRLADTRAVN